MKGKKHKEESIKLMCLNSKLCWCSSMVEHQFCKLKVIGSSPIISF